MSPKCKLHKGFFAILAAGLIDFTKYGTQVLHYLSLTFS